MIRKTPQDQRFHDHPEEAVTKKLESKKRQYYNISQKRRNYMQSYLDNQIWTCNSSIPFLFFFWKKIFLKKKSTKVQTKSVYFSAYFTRKEFILELASFGLCTKITKVKITWASLLTGELINQDDDAQKMCSLRGNKKVVVIFNKQFESHQCWEKTSHGQESLDLHGLPPPPCK